MSLTENDVLKILKLIEESKFEELQLKMDDLNLVVRKSNGISRIENVAAVIPGTMALTAAEPAADAKPVVKEETATKAEEAAAAPASDAELVSIKANLLGVVYFRPEPTAPPFVEVGSYVEEDTTVCLIEIMKVFNAVKAGVKGYVEKICVQNGDLVEYGQTLFLIRP